MREVQIILIFYRDGTGQFAGRVVKPRGRGWYGPGCIKNSGNKKGEGKRQEK